MNRSTRSSIAEQTVEIVKRGAYDLPDGRQVEIASAVQACLNGTRFFPPEQLECLRHEALSRPSAETSTVFEVHNETTLAGIRRLLKPELGPVAALNFASARNPGGGFLTGAQAQEESLARSSALYASLLRAPEYYERHRAMRSPLYSHAMILSPGCPVFREDDGSLMMQPLDVAFITSAAPNAGAVAQNAPNELPVIPEVLRRRAEYVLALAAASGYEHLVLGAWGCGVFRNDPTDVAGAFAQHLRDGDWSKRFRRVVFSVLDTSTDQDTFRAFREAFDAK